MELNVEEVAREILKHPCKNIVFTGGEPMLQQRELVKLMRSLNGEGTEKGEKFRFEVETNATIPPSKEFDALINQYNCSPKLANSSNTKSNAKKLRELPQVYRFFADHPKAFFKFVAASQQDLVEILELAGTYRIPKEKIYLMPEGITAKALNEKKTWVVAACAKHGFLFTTRLHVEKYGNRRGV